MSNESQQIEAFINERTAANAAANQGNYSNGGRYISYVESGRNLGSFSGVSRDWLTKWYVYAIMWAMENLGQGQRQYKGRAEDYANMLGLWGENKSQIKTWINTCTKNESSCGLVVRSLWRLLGLRCKRLEAPYNPKTKNVLSVIPQIADDYGALKPPLTRRSDPATHDHWTKDDKEKDFAALSTGDVVYIDNSQHVFTVIEKEKDTGKLISIDGGQWGGTASCCEIKRRERIFNKYLQWFDPEKGHLRTINYIVKLDTMIENICNPSYPFPGPSEEKVTLDNIVCPIKNTGNAPGAQSSPPS
jgi:hypothetical protein